MCHGPKTNCSVCNIIYMLLVVYLQCLMGFEDSFWVLIRVYYGKVACVVVLLLT
jgi:hypothetical protein